MADAQHDNIIAKRQALAAAIASNELALGEAVLQMRKISGLNQKAYARDVVGISPRILAEIERNQGNPTLGTLNKIARPFGFTIGFVPQRRSVVHRRLRS